MLIGPVKVEWLPVTRELIGVDCLLFAITIRTSDGVMFDIMTLGETPSVLMNSAKVAVCGSGG